MVKNRGHRDRKKQNINQCEEKKSAQIIVYIKYIL